MTASPVGCSGVSGPVDGRSVAQIRADLAARIESAFIVRGGYTEVVHPDPAHALDESQRKTWRRFSLHRLSTREAHRIVHLQDQTITLVFTGRRSRSWGFWTPNGFVDWTKYTQPGLGPDPFGTER